MLIMTKQILEAGLKLYHPKRNKQFWDLHQYENIQAITKQTSLNACRRLKATTIKRAGNLQHATKLIKLALLPLHKMQRLSVARKTTWDDQWIQVVFSNENK